MGFQRVRRGVCPAAIHEPGAHQPAAAAGRRHLRHQSAAAANRGAAARSVLRLSFGRNPVAVVWPRRAGVVAGRRGCERRAGAAELFRLAARAARTRSQAAGANERRTGLQGHAAGQIHGAASGSPDHRCPTPGIDPVGGCGSRTPENGDHESLDDGGNRFAVRGIVGGQCGC